MTNHVRVTGSEAHNAPVRPVDRSTVYFLLFPVSRVVLTQYYKEESRFKAELEGKRYFKGQLLTLSLSFFNSAPSLRALGHADAHTRSD